MTPNPYAKHMKVLSSLLIILCTTTPTKTSWILPNTIILPEEVCLQFPCVFKGEEWLLLAYFSVVEGTVHVQVEDETEAVLFEKTYTSLSSFKKQIAKDLR